MRALKKAKSSLKGRFVMDHAVVDADCVTATKAVVLKNTSYKPSYFYTGVPTKDGKPMSEAQAKSLRRMATNQQHYANWLKPLLMPE